jgi:endonuclease/exonuclease/phosphatase family metal-dependent hydrolase
MIAAVCLLLSYLCCFVNPETVWWLGFFGLGYIYLLCVNVGFTIIWLFAGKWKYALLSLATILIGWNMIIRTVQFSKEKLPEQELAGSIKVISYNVHLFSQRNAEQPDGRKQDFFDYIRESGVKILCMQEFAASRWKGGLTEQLICRHLDMMAYSHIEYTAGSNVGIATFSAYPIIRRQLIYSDKTTNACMFSDVVINSDTVRIYNVHLKSIGFSREERALLNDAIKPEYDNSDVKTLKDIVRQMTLAFFDRSQQVDLVAGHISKSPYPVIICGDFNDSPISYSYQKIRSNRKDSFIEAGKGMGTTYNIGRISSQRIDNIMYSPFFRAYAHESPRVKYSDHYPVMCRLIKQK